MFVVVCWSSLGYKPFIASLLERGPPPPPPHHRHHHLSPDRQIVLRDAYTIRGRSLLKVKEKHPPLSNELTKKQTKQKSRLENPFLRKRHCGFCLRLVRYHLHSQAGCMQILIKDEGKGGRRGSLNHVIWIPAFSFCSSPRTFFFPSFIFWLRRGIIGTPSLPPPPGQAVQDLDRFTSANTFGH